MKKRGILLVHLFNYARIDNNQKKIWKYSLIKCARLVPSLNKKKGILRHP